MKLGDDPAGITELCTHAKPIFLAVLRAELFVHSSALDLQGDKRSCVLQNNVFTTNLQSLRSFQLWALFVF